MLAGQSIIGVYYRHRGHRPVGHSTTCSAELQHGQQSSGGLLAKIRKIDSGIPYTVRTLAELSLADSYALLLRSEFTLETQRS